MESEVRPSPLKSWFSLSFLSSSLASSSFGLSLAIALPFCAFVQYENSCFLFLFWRQLPRIFVLSVYREILTVYVCLYQTLAPALATPHLLSDPIAQVEVGTIEDFQTADGSPPSCDTHTPPFCARRNLEDRFFDVSFKTASRNLDHLKSLRPSHAHPHSYPREISSASPAPSFVIRGSREEEWI